jgi:D-aminoacyl-tRNA deacylase
MRFGIVYCKKNIAGKNIVDQFKKLVFAPQIPIIELNEEAIYSKNINKEKYPELRKVDFLFFASTHRSIKGKPSLCLHVAGNWKEAELGGRKGKVCPTSAFVMKYLFQKLNENANKKKEIIEKYNISMEATHHGPLIDIPSCFIELGSNEEDWKDEIAAKVIAKTILSLENYNKDISKGWIPTFAIGGTHYCPNFNKIQLNSNYAISHVIPEYGFPVTEKIILEAEEKTKEQINEVLIDWKGCKGSEGRQEILKNLEKVGLKVKRTNKVEK